MGGAFSSGEDNDDLVNILILLGHIRSKKVERVFRAVDRADYVLSSQKDLAYKDLSIKHGNIHLSAPCVYCKVMEGLTLKPGLSFLNIGSGTGYLSTLAGLILGRNGINHGIEMHEDCLMFAYVNLEKFKENSLDVDTFEFCEPVFQLGNILNASPNRQYDRVYCGAACPEIHEQYIKQFVKIGGILVMPYKDNLLRIERLDETTWRNTTMLPVSFSTLVTPPEDKERAFFQLPVFKPHTLQELCRSRIRCHLRKLVWSENGDLVYKAPLKAKPIERTVPQLGIPFFESGNRGQWDRDGSETDEDETDRPRMFFRVGAHRREEVTSTLRLVRAVVQLNEESKNCDETLQEAPTPVDSAEIVPSASFEASNHTPMEADDFMDAGTSATEEKLMETTTSMDVEMKDCACDQKETIITRPPDSKLKRKSEAIGPHPEPHNSQRYRVSDKDEDSGETSGVNVPARSSEAPVVINDPEEPEEEDSLNFAWIGQAFSILMDTLVTELDDETSDCTLYVSDSSNEEDAPLCKERALPDSDTDEDEEKASNSQESRANKSRTFKKLRSKNESSSEPAALVPVEDGDENSKLSNKYDCNSESTSDEDLGTEECRRTSRTGRRRRRSNTSRSNESSNDTDASDSSDSTDLNTDFNFNFIHEENLKRNAYAHILRKEQISHFMRKKVNSLPLPLQLRLYLNYNRDL